MSSSKRQADPFTTRALRVERKEYNAKIDDLMRMVEEANKRAAFVTDIREAKRPPHIMPREKTSGIREMTAVVLASDWHVEESVDKASVEGRNEYSLAIADVRIARFFEAIIWQVEHHRASGKVAIRDLVLWLGGDLMSGYIHDELLEGNALSPTRTMLWLLPRIRDGIHTLLSRLKLDKLIVPCSIGNHGRTTKKTHVATGYANSFEWCLYNIIAEEFAKDPRVEFVITASMHQYVRAYDKTLHFHHGDSLKYMGGVGGLTIPLMKALPGWRSVRHSDISHIGHFHCLTDVGSAMVNGSMIGYGAYSNWIKAKFEQPQQAFYLLDSKRGKTNVAPLWVGEKVT